MDSWEKIEADIADPANWRKRAMRHMDLHVAEGWAWRISALRERDEKRWEIVRAVRDALEREIDGESATPAQDVLDGDFPEWIAKLDAALADRLREAREGRDA